MNKTTLEERFEEKFIEFAPDGSNWGAGLRIRHTGTTQDREILDDIKDFIKQELQQERERCVEIAKDVTNEVKNNLTGTVEFYDGIRVTGTSIINAINQDHE